MIKSEWQATESLRKCLCAGGITAPRAFLKQGYGFLRQQHVKRDFDS
jgi:hypothetical protein